MRKKLTVLIILLFLIQIVSLPNFSQTGSEELFNRGMRYFRSNYFETAIQILNQALAGDLAKSQRIEAHLTIGIACLAINQLDKGREHFMNVLKEEPNYGIREDQHPADIIRVFNEVRESFKNQQEEETRKRQIMREIRTKRIIQLESGLEITGWILSSDNDTLVVDTEELGSITIQKSKIKKITPPLAESIGTVIQPGDSDKKKTPEPVSTGATIEKEGLRMRPKSRIPLAVVIGFVAVVIGVTVLILTKGTSAPEKESIVKYRLTVDKSEGAEGTPLNGAFEYNQGETVSYNYSLKSGYTNLQIFLDGVPKNTSGNIVMDADHNLTVTTDRDSFRSGRFTYSADNERVSDGEPKDFTQNIGLSGYIKNVRYGVEMSDDAVEDLSITLRSPAGTTLSVLQAGDSAGTGYSKTGTTSVFNNEQIKGAWTLTVNDGTVSDTVRFGTWWIEFTYSKVPGLFYRTQKKTLN